MKYKIKKEKKINKLKVIDKILKKIKEYLTNYLFILQLYEEHNEQDKNEDILDRTNIPDDLVVTECLSSEQIILEKMCVYVIQLHIFLFKP